jgi:hypothetical protein
MRLNYDGTLSVYFKLSRVVNSVEEALSSIMNGSKIKSVTVELDDGQRVCLDHYHIEVRDVEIDIKENA